MSLGLLTGLVAVLAAFAVAVFAVAMDPFRPSPLPVPPKATAPQPTGVANAHTGSSTVRTESTRPPARAFKAGMRTAGILESTKELRPVLHRAPAGSSTPNHLRALVARRRPKGLARIFRGISPVRVCR